MKFPWESRCNASGNLEGVRKKENKESRGCVEAAVKMAAPTRFVSPNAEVVSKTQALMVNVAAARGLQNVLKTNLGESVALLSVPDAFSKSNQACCLWVREQQISGSI